MIGTKMEELRKKYIALAEKLDDDEDILLKEEVAIYAMLGLRHITIHNKKFAVARFFDAIEELLKAEDL